MSRSLPSSRDVRLVPSDLAAHWQYTGILLDQVDLAGNSRTFPGTLPGTPGKAHGGDGHEKRVQGHFPHLACACGDFDVRPLLPQDAAVTLLTLLVFSLNLHTRTYGWNPARLPPCPPRVSPKRKEPRVASGLSRRVHGGHQGDRRHRRRRHR